MKWNKSFFPALTFLIKARRCKLSLSIDVLTLYAVGDKDIQSLQFLKEADPDV